MEFEPTEVGATIEEVRSLSAKLRFGAEKPYPIDASELLGNNLAGLAAWATAIALPHLGPLHPFLDYSQRPLNQTGRRHLNTGAVLEKGATFGAESDEQIRIALAAHWGALAHARLTVFNRG